MPCQVSAQSVVANSWPLVQGSGVFASDLVSPLASWPNARVDEKKRTANARNNLVFVTFPPKQTNLECCISRGTEPECSACVERTQASHWLIEPLFENG